MKNHIAIIDTFLIKTVKKNNFWKIHIKLVKKAMSR